MKKIYTKPQYQLAEHWRVSQEQISKWHRAGCDFDAPEIEVARWIKKHAKRKSKALREKLAPYFNQPASPKKSKPKVDEAAEDGNRSLEEMRDYYREKLSAATEAKAFDREDVKFWNDLLLKTDESIRRSQAHAAKLGIDNGEMMAREEVERIIKVMVYAGNACTRGIVNQAAERLAAMDQPKEVEAFLRPLVLGFRLFEGFSKVSKAAGPSLLRRWFIDAMQSEGERYLNGVDVGK